MLVDSGCGFLKLNCSPCCRLAKVFSRIAFIADAEALVRTPRVLKWFATAVNPDSLSVSKNSATPSRATQTSTQLVNNIVGGGRVGFGFDEVEEFG